MTNFYSIQFIVFLVVTLIGYYTVLRKKQWICLLVASMVFYYFSGVENFLFLLLTGLTTWIGARKLTQHSANMANLRADKSIDKEEKKAKKEIIVKKRRAIMWGVLLLNFGILACLKYVEPILKGMGILSGDNVLGLVLPLGISFYTFQSIGYLLDVYFEKYGAEQNFGKYLLFVSYFPQLIQGPINRYDMLREQFAVEHKVQNEQIKRAILQIMFGVMKKFAIANILADMVSLTLDHPELYHPGCIIVFGILLYSVQQYADFSGGIDMVLGVSKLFGIEMMVNFRQPYFATSLADFWRRWHISLGKWMRDYIFYPFALTKPMKKLGKWANKCFGKHIGRVLPAALGNILVFFVVGLWHGAQWHFILWGLYNGIVIAISDFLAPLFLKLTLILRINTSAKWFRVFQIARTFLIVNVGWYFDRIEDVGTCIQYFRSTIRAFELYRFRTIFGEIFWNIPSHSYKVVCVASILVLVNSILCEQKKDVYALIQKRSILIRWGLYYLMLMLILVSFTCTNNTGGFMYANF